MRPALPILVLLASSCIHVHVKAADTPTGGAGLEPGDRVIARWKQGFWDATVISVHGQLVSVAWDTPPPERSYVPRGWVERRDAAGGPVQAGEWRLCEGEPSWALCRVTEAPGQLGALVTYEDGRNRRLPAAHLLPVPAGLREWARVEGERRLARVDFVARLASLAPASAGRAVAAGQTVLARWSDGGWYEATVEQVAGGQIVVAWRDGSPSTPVGMGDVASFDAPAPEAGGYAFCRRGDSTQFAPARVERAGSARLAVMFPDGEIAEVLGVDCVAAASTLGVAAGR